MTRWNNFSFKLNIIILNTLLKIKIIKYVCYKCLYKVDTHMLAGIMLCLDSIIDVHSNVEKSFIILIN